MKILIIVIKINVNINLLGLLFLAGKNMYKTFSAHALPNAYPQERRSSRAYLLLYRWHIIILIRPRSLLAALI